MNLRELTFWKLHGTVTYLWTEFCSKYQRRNVFYGAKIVIIMKPYTQKMHD